MTNTHQHEVLELAGAATSLRCFDRLSTIIRLRTRRNNPFRVQVSEHRTEQTRNHMKTMLELTNQVS